MSRFSKPNVWRLQAKLSDSRDTVRGSKTGYFKLSHLFIRKMEAAYPALTEKSQDVVDDGTVLPPSLYSGTRSYVESLAKQINASYEHNIFDGCAVLMRRLEEILLIHTYEKLGLESEIKDGHNNYMLLEGISKNAQQNSKLGLSRNTPKTIETFRELGNFSAHKLSYICRREYIKQDINEYRAMIEELLHKSGIKN